MVPAAVRRQRPLALPVSVLARWGSLSGSQVEREGPAAQVHTNPAAAAELAEAERALALHYATEEQIERLHEADRYRTAADRRHAWEEVGRSSRGVDSPPSD